MSSIKRTSIIILFLLFIISSVFAQLPDPYDPTFLPKYHVLHPKEVVKNHVRSCNIFQDGQLYGTILYDSEGYVLSSFPGENNFTILNEKGLRKEEYLFSSHEYVGKITYEYNPYGDPLKSFKEEISLLGKSTTNTLYEYAKGLLSTIKTDYRFDMAYVINSSTTIKTFFYDDKRQLSRVEMKQNSSSLSVYDQTSLTFWTTFYYQNNKPIREVNADVELKYYYNEKGQLDHINEVNDDTTSFVLEITSETYTYYDNGLVKSKTVLIGNAWTYEYDYIQPAKFNLMISNEFKQISFWNYGLNSDRQNHPIEKDIVRAKVYTPYMELYAVQLTPQLALPVIFTPGKTVNMSASTNGINVADTDTANLMILEIEGAIQQAFTIFNQEKASEEVAKYILQQMEAYPDLPSYLFYTKYWDTVNHKQTYLDYTERMIIKYPHTFKVNEAYALLRK